jgi:hypothetical protein
VGLGCCSVNAWTILIVSSTLWFIESSDNMVQSGTIAVPSWQKLLSGNLSGKRGRRRTRYSGDWMWTRKVRRKKVGWECRRTSYGLTHYSRSLFICTAGPALVEGSESRWRLVRSSMG